MKALYEDPRYVSATERFVPAASDTIEDVILAANVQARIAVPAGANFVSFSFSDSIRAKFGTSAVSVSIPSSTTSNGSGSAFNPDVRRIPVGATHIAVICANSATGSMEFWS